MPRLCAYFADHVGAQIMNRRQFSNDHFHGHGVSQSEDEEAERRFAATLKRVLATPPDHKDETGRESGKPAGDRQGMPS